MNLLQIVLDVVFLLAGAVFLVYIRLVRARMRRLSQERSRRPLPEPVGTFPRQEERNSLSRETQELKSLLARMTMERSRLQVAFYDAERMIDDLEAMDRSQPSGSLSPSPVSTGEAKVKEESPDPAVSAAPKAPLSEQEKAVAWSRSGQSVAQIAEKLGRSEGEVELILGMARLSGGGGR